MCANSFLLRNPMHLPRLRHRTRNRPQFDYGQTSGDFGTCSLPGKRLGFLATKLICKHALVCANSFLLRNPMHLPRLRHRTRNRPQFDYGQTSGDFGTCSLPGKRLGFLATKLICKHALVCANSFLLRNPMHLPRLRHRTRNRPQFDYGQTSGDFGTCSLPGKRLGFLATKLICKHFLLRGCLISGPTVFFSSTLGTSPNRDG